jgi:hypothetical protein
MKIVEIDELMGFGLISLYLSYFFLDEKVCKKSRQNVASDHRPCFFTFFFLYSSFCLIKRKQNSRQNDASAHRPYAGPPFCRAVAFLASNFLFSMLHGI